MTYLFRRPAPHAGQLSNTTGTDRTVQPSNSNLPPYGAWPARRHEHSSLQERSILSSRFKWSESAIGALALLLIGVALVSTTAVEHNVNDACVTYDTFAQEWIYFLESDSFKVDDIVFVSPAAFGGKSLLAFRRANSCRIDARY